MCELLAVAWPEPRALGPMLERALAVERLGIDGFGWGVAWLEATGRLRGYRNVASLAEDRDGRLRLAEVESTRFLIHLRRPTLLSTIQTEDTQPFVAPDGGFAFAHNGRFERHDAARARYAAQLRGQADSEVGFVHFGTLLESDDPVDALRRTLADFGGFGNLLSLGADGAIAAVGSHHLNPLWHFRLDGGVAASTACHSDDDSVFRLVFTDAIERELIGPEGLTFAR